MEADLNHRPRHIDVPKAFGSWTKAGTDKPRNIGPTAFAWITEFRRQTFLLSNGLRIRCDTKPEWSVGSLVMLKSAVRLGARSKAIKNTKITGRVDPLTFEGTLPRCNGIATGANDGDDKFEVVVKFMGRTVQVELPGESQDGKVAQIEGSILAFTPYFLEGVMKARDAKIIRRCSPAVKHSRKWNSSPHTKGYQYSRSLCGIMKSKFGVHVDYNLDVALSPFEFAGGQELYNFVRKNGPTINSREAVVVVVVVVVVLVLVLVLVALVVLAWTSGHRWQGKTPHLTKERIWLLCKIH